MDWNFAIEKHREALKRILAALVAMAGFSASTSPLWGGRRSSDRRVGALDTDDDSLPPAALHFAGDPDISAISPAISADDRVTGSIGRSASKPHNGEMEPESRPTLPRHLHRAILRLLRPAESAARRLVIAAARGLVVTLPPPRPRKPAIVSLIVRNGVGTGIVMPRMAPLTFLRMGEGKPPHSESATRFPVGGNRAPGFPLFDTLAPFRRRRPAASGVPRISAPGITAPFPVAVRRPPAPDDPLDATRLGHRLQTLASVLDDLPAQARRFARWKTRRDAAIMQDRQNREAAPANSGKPSRARRIWPLRPGRPPGWRKSSRHAVHEVLADTNWLARCALEAPDTS